MNRLIFFFQKIQEDNILSVSYAKKKRFKNASPNKMDQAGWPNLTDLIGSGLFFIFLN